MANWETLKEAIGQVIKTNGREEITGQIMQNVLFSIINQVGKMQHLREWQRPEPYRERRTKTFLFGDGSR